MNSSFSRRFVIGGGLASLAGSALADAPAASLIPKNRPRGLALANVKPVEELLAASGLSGKISFVVADANTREFLEVKSPILALPPASVAKSLTTLYGVSALGAGFQFKTLILATGPLKNGRIEGDLVLQGGGDPTLDSDALGDMAKALKAAGVREISGSFLIDAHALPYVPSIDPNQPDHLGYNPSVSGLNLNYNRVHFEWKRAAQGYNVTMQARADRFRPAVSVSTMKIINRDLPIYTYANAKGIDHWTVAKSALGQAGARWLPVRKPAMYAADVFQTLARSYGIRLPNPVQSLTPMVGNLFVEHNSADLSVLLKGMLKYSTNLTAEAVGMMASQHRGETLSSLPMSGQLMSDWLNEQMGMRRLRFVDHSGLGDASRVSARDMVSALVKVGPNGMLRPLLKDIPVRDAKGNVQKGHPVKIKAKTGTLNFVSALAGYITTPDGRELAFAIFTADSDRRAMISRADREVPEGARPWARRSRRLQQDLIARWATVYNVGV